jgi:hypothetical protein
MRLRLLQLMVILFVVAPSPAPGMYVTGELTNVPIARLFTNLQQRLAEKTNDFQITYYLARLHSMAYATNLIEVEVGQPAV